MIDELPRRPGAILSRSPVAARKKLVQRGAQARWTRRVGGKTRRSASRRASPCRLLLFRAQVSQCVPHTEKVKVERVVSRRLRRACPIPTSRRWTAASAFALGASYYSESR